MKYFKIGDRVTRSIYMDDGTWRIKGDSCLPGPQKHGTVINIIKDAESKMYDLVYVRFDDNSIKRYFQFEK